MSLNGHKALYQPWNEEEFQADAIVRSMTNLERWMYRALLQQAFVCSTRPYLPDNDNLLWRLAGCDSKVDWDKCKRTVRSMFVKFSPDGQKLLKQKRVEMDWIRENEYRRKLSEKNRDNANKRWNKDRMPQGCEPDATGMPNDATELNCTEQNRTVPNGTERPLTLSQFADKVL
jgi:hypothetical protein